MEVLYKNCCGLDVHKNVIVACILNGKNRFISSFKAMTADILDLVDWIKVNNCEAVAMESTGVYWKPIYNLLEAENIKTLVVNAKHMKAVPGRKTDVKDSEWIADLLKHGLLKASFIPSRDQRELRELVRYRKSIIEERSREVTRIQKILEGANIKLSSVASDVLGVSGRKMLEAIVDGVTDPKILASFAKSHLKKKLPELERALNGLIKDHQKKLLSIQLKHIDFLQEHLEEHIEAISNEIDTRLKEEQEIIELLDEILGIGKRSAAYIISEIGTDMSIFPTANHLGLCPGNNESAGKQKSVRTREGNKALRGTLVECARSCVHCKDTYFFSQYSRISVRRGKNKAAVAVAHSMLIIIYNMIKYKTHYKEMGADYFDKLNSESKIARLKKKLESLGYSVSKQEIPA